MIQDNFKYKPSTTYKIGGHYKVRRDALDIISDIVNPTIKINQKDEFKVRYLDIFNKYKIDKIKTEMEVNRWRNNHMMFLQNQINFAVWCATTGCGVGIDNHLKNTDPFMRSLYNFHTYFTIRRILKEMEVNINSLTPNSHSQYNVAAYQNICREFKGPLNSNWRQMSFTDTQGLGTVYAKGLEYGGSFYREKVGIGTVLPFFSTEYEYLDRKSYSNWQYKDYINKKMTFGKETPNPEPQCNSDDRCWWRPPLVAHVEYIEQPPTILNTVSTFMVGKGEGFTQAGIVRINESIRTYVWALLAAQIEVRKPLGRGAESFGAQKQFISLVESKIRAAWNVTESVNKYQQYLSKTKTPVNYVFGIGLYMAPSNIIIEMGNIGNFNNKLIIASEGISLGLNNKINAINSRKESRFEFEREDLQEDAQLGGVISKESKSVVLDEELQLEDDIVKYKSKIINFIEGDAELEKISIEKDKTFLDNFEIMAVVGGLFIIYFLKKIL